MTDKNLRTDDLDRLGQALITLSKEVWVLKDRQKVLEAALTKAGVLAPDSVDTFQPDDSLSNQLKSERAEFIQQVLNALTK